MMPQRVLIAPVWVVARSVTPDPEVETVSGRAEPEHHDVAARAHRAHHGTMNPLPEHRLDPSTVTPDELRRITQLMELGGPARLVSATGEQVPLPPALSELLAYVLEQVQRQQAILVMPEDQALTTNQAAGILGVSRPYLIGLLDDGKIPFRRTGSHRRILLTDLRAYQAERDRERRRALDELTVALDEAGVYDRE